MPWTIDDTTATATPNLPRTCARTYYAWRRDIRDNGNSPKDAAEAVGDAHYEKYQGGGSRYTIRLSQRHRVWFNVDEVSESVVVRKVGTHKEPTNW